MTYALPTAADGDGDFTALVLPHARELHLHCYRMLGSVTDAEDVLQEVLLAAWRGLDDFGGRASLRTWLYRIATNRCLNAIRAGRRRLPTEPMAPFEPPPASRESEVTWLQPYPDVWLDELDPALSLARRETVELTFIAALQRMPPRQAAVLVLVDVLGFTGPEVAGMLDTTSTSVKGALQRARAAVHSQAPPATDNVAEKGVARRFAEAFVADDIDAVVALLTDNAWLSMPPAPQEYVGLAAIAGFLRTSAAARTSRLELEPVGVNRQPGFHCWFVDGRGVRRPAGLIALATGAEANGQDATITAIIRFLGAVPGTSGLADG